MIFASAFRPPPVACRASRRAAPRFLRNAALTMFRTARREANSRERLCLKRWVRACFSQKSSSSAPCPLLGTNSRSRLCAAWRCRARAASVLSCRMTSPGTVDGMRLGSTPSSMRSTLKMLRIECSTNVVTQSDSCLRRAADQPGISLTSVSVDQPIKPLSRAGRTEAALLSAAIPITG